MSYPVINKHYLIIFLVSLYSLAACNYSSGVSAGVKKDLSTGLSTTYKNMAPDKVFLVMNGEVLNTSDIPLGQKFTVMNENVKGLKERDGKISMGCSLKITDEAGKIMLEEKDLFEGGDIFKPEDAGLLQCGVTTGEPMNWEEKYKVDVVFWDKYGDGKIENKLTIRAIRKP